MADPALIDPTTAQAPVTPAAPAAPLGATAAPQLIPTNSSAAPSPANSIIPGATNIPTVPNATVAPVSANETVSGQLTDLLKSGSPYIDLARSQALEAASRRGLQNSSIAAGSGEAAAITSGLPIAQQDASTYAARTAANLGAANTFGQTEAQKQATMAAQAAQIQEQTQQQLATQQQQAELTKGVQAAQISEQTQQQLTTQAAQGEINKALQAQAEAANINQIITQGDVNKQLQASANAFTAIQNDLARGQELTLANVNFQNQQKLIIAQMSASSQLSAQDAAQQLQRLNVSNQATLNNIAAQAAATKSLMGPQLQSQYLQAVSQRMASASQEISAIYATQGLTAAQQQNAVQIANQRMQTDVASLQAYYSSSPLWDPNFGGGTPAQPAAPAPTAPATGTGPAGTATPNTGPVAGTGLFPDTLNAAWQQARNAGQNVVNP